MHITQAIAPDTKALVDLLVATPVGDTVTYSAMSEAIGSPIKRRRHLIPAAIRIAARDHGVVFGSVRSVGYKRLPASDAHILGAHARRRIRRTAKRTSDAIISAITKTNDLSAQAKVRAYAEVNAMALIRHIATDKEVVAATTEPKAEPVAHIARRFAQHIGAIE